MLPAYQRDPLSAVTAATMLLPGGAEGVIGLAVARGECSWIQIQLPDDTDAIGWLHAEPGVDAVVLDARVGRDVRITQPDATCPIPRVDGGLQVDGIELSGSAAGDANIVENVLLILSCR